MIAYHESGHALLMTLLPNADPLNKVTIIPRSSGAGGFAQQLPNEELLSIRRSLKKSLVFPGSLRTDVK